MEGEPILKKTLVTMGAMVGACVVFVGTVSIAAVTITSYAVGGGASSSEPVVVPAQNVEHGGSAAPKNAVDAPKASHQRT